MTLEISARCSGKTQRMMRAVNDYLNDNENGLAVVVGQRGIFKRDYLLYAIDEPNRHRVVFQYKMIGMFDDNIKVKYFVDDFDLIDPQFLFIDSNNYYVTTPKKIRESDEKDFFTDLMNAFDDKYRSFGYLGDHRELIDQIGKDNYDREHFYCNQ